MFTIIFLVLLALVIIGYIVMGIKKDRDIKEALRKMSDAIIILDAKVDELEKTLDRQDFN